MKSVLLMRHGKSDWGADYSTDHDRPLKTRGVRAARSMGWMLAELDEPPDLVVTSSATRARDTARLAVESGGWECPIEESSELYGAGPAGVLGKIRTQDDALRRLLVVGHQPTWSRLAGELVGGAEIRFPTAAVARIDFQVPRWDQIDYGDGTLIWLLIPRLLASIGFTEPGG